MRRVVALLFAGLLLAVLVTPASAGMSSQWHRVNPGNPPGHERLICVGEDAWRCLYDVLP